MWPNKPRNADTANTATAPTMLPPTCGRRLVLLLHRASAAAAGGTNPLQHKHQPQLLAVRLPHHYHLYSSTTHARTPDPVTESFLVASCGYSPAAAAAATNWMRIHSTAKADAVLDLLRRYGFSDAQITRMLRKIPRLILLDPDKIVRPKLEFFARLGVGAAAIARSDLLERSLEKHIVPCVQFLHGILGSDAKVRTVFSTLPFGTFPDLNKRMRPAVEALRRHGITEKVISKIFSFNVGFCLLPLRRIDETCKDLEALGLIATESGFANGFRVLSSLKRESWLRKVALYQSIGVSRCELLKAFKTQPTILAYSLESIQKKLRFFLDELKLEINDVMGKPVLLGYSLEKTIVPRCAVLSLLMREGKIEPDIKLLTALPCSSKIFSEKYVLRYADDVPDVVKANEGKIKFEGFKNCNV